MTEPRKIAHYGWIPDLPDERDHIYAAPPRFLSALPPSKTTPPKPAQNMFVVDIVTVAN